VCLALSGGRIAIPFFQAIVAAPAAREIPWDAVHFFWADERCVPADDPESNYATAERELLRPLGINPANVHRIRGELQPSKAAQAATEELEAVRSSRPDVRDGDIATTLDLVLLGMGEDGHIASLFPPLRPELQGPAMYVAVRGPKPPPDRVTLSFGALAAARHLWVLVSGEGKTHALQAVLGGACELPLGHLLDMRPDTRIYTDIHF
jgi:6-phosphogluconolactonase